MPHTAPAAPTAPSAPAPSPATAAPEIDRFTTRLQASLADGSFVKLQLARPHGTEPSLDKLLVRRVLLRGQDHLQLLWRHRTKDITKNLPLAEGVATLAGLVATQFHHAHLLTRGHDIQLALDKKGRWGLRIGKLAGAAAEAAAPNTAAHDRARPRALSLDLPFLQALGITDAQQRLVPAMARKWKQINHFVELLSHALDAAALPTDRPVRVLDFGAGKGYLTFAVHHHLLQRGLQPQVTGVELREDLTALCNSAVATLGLAGLQFVTGDVRRHAAEPIDVMIALHACNTATDVALHRGLRGGAAVILCSPCCHQELRPQITPPAVLAPVLRHGIHLTEQAEVLTDSLRALMLQASGYDTTVAEFISPEQTGKNKMVQAVRRRQPPSAAQVATLQAQAAELMAFYGVRSQYLVALLAAEAAGQAAPREPVATLPAAYRETVAEGDGHRGVGPTSPPARGAVGG